jgi:hypothetical protein
MGLWARTLENPNNSVLEAWKRAYNEQGPAQFAGHVAPAVFAQSAFRMACASQVDLCPIEQMNGHISP